MARGDANSAAALKKLAAAPQIRLLGSVDEQLLDAFCDQLAKVAEEASPIAVELTSEGGDAEIGRRLQLEVKLARERLGRRLVCIGKTVVYSAATTMFSGFPREDRYLTEDAVLLVHCRQMERTLTLQGPLRACRIRVEQLLSELRMGIDLEEQGFAALVEGSDIGFDEVCERAAKGWYIPAAEALERRLIAAIV